MMLLLTMALFMSCGDDDEVKLPDMKDVNYANIAGTWRLSEWNGEKIDGDTRYYYIKFDRKEKDGKPLQPRDESFRVRNGQENCNRVN